MTWNGVVLEDEAPESGCSWPLIWPCDAPADADIAEWCEQMAIEILWAASGRQFGVCASTYRPCQAGCEGGAPMVNAWNLVGQGGWLKWDPWGGSVFARIACGCGDVCSCTSIESINLWHRNVRSIIEVVIDGIVMDPSQYRLSRNRLIRIDGDLWPICQDWTVPAGAEGSWTVAYVHGRAVPFGGRVAGGILASELGKAVCGEESCELPRRIQTITRQNVSVAFADPLAFLDKGQTGLYEVDLWLHSVNPHRLARRARVHRVDDPRRRRPIRG